MNDKINRPPRHAEHKTRIHPTIQNGNNDPAEIRIKLRDQKIAIDYYLFFQYFLFLYRVKGHPPL